MSVEIRTGKNGVEIVRVSGTDEVTKSKVFGPFGPPIDPKHNNVSEPGYQRYDYAAADAKRASALADGSDIPDDHVKAAKAHYLAARLYARQSAQNVPRIRAQMNHIAQAQHHEDMVDALAGDFTNKALGLDEANKGGYDDSNASELAYSYHNDLDNRWGRVGEPIPEHLRERAAAQHEHVAMLHDRAAEAHRKSGLPLSGSFAVTHADAAKTLRETAAKLRGGDASKSIDGLSPRSAREKLAGMDPAEKVLFAVDGVPQCLTADAASKALVGVDERSIVTMGDEAEKALTPAEMGRAAAGGGDPGKRAHAIGDYAVKKTRQLARGWHAENHEEVANLHALAARKHREAEKAAEHPWVAEHHRALSDYHKRMSEFHWDAAERQRNHGGEEAEKGLTAEPETSEARASKRAFHATRAAFDPDALGATHNAKYHREVATIHDAAAQVADMVSGTPHSAARAKLHRAYAKAHRDIAAAHEAFQNG